MSNNFWTKRKSQEQLDNDPFICLKVYIPRSTFKMLDELRFERQVPVSRLIAYAIDNEFDSKIPFNYPCALPAHDFIEYEYADEAARMATFMERFPAGVSKDSLMLLRRDMKIEQRSRVMGAYRELLTVGMIEEFRGRNMSYGPMHRIARLVGLTKKALTKKRYKRIEGESTNYKTITDDMVERSDEEQHDE